MAIVLIRFFYNLYINHLIYCSKSINLFTNGVFDFNKSRWAKYAIYLGLLVNLVAIIIFVNVSF